MEGSASESLASLASRPGAFGDQLVLSRWSDNSYVHDDDGGGGGGDDDGGGDGGGGGDDDGGGDVSTLKSHT